jgi:UDP-N-acetylmuramoylalanine--D-glutamate ligase
MMTVIMDKERAITIDDLRGMRVLVIGLARSGIAACNVLRTIGSEVKATDTKTAEVLLPGLGQLKGVELELGRNSIEFARDCDLLVVSPGVPLETEVVKWAYDHDVTVISEIELAWCVSDAKFVAVTGTNGKSTTVSLLGRILSEGTEKVRVGGNIGYPISEVAYGLGPDWTLVIEVSSFQLDTCLSFGPEVSVLLNITPDHLDRYTSYEAYVNSKARLFANQTPEDFAIINHDDPECMRASREAKSQKLYFSVQHELEEGAFVRGDQAVVRVGGSETEVFLIDQLRIRGPHNLTNSLAASLAAAALGFGPAVINAGIRAFEGLEHRLEPVAVIGGVEFINDSKATNVDSLRCALEGTPRPIILIAGGRDKGGDFTQVESLVADKVKAIVTIGEARGKIARTLTGLTEITFANDLEGAARCALDLAEPGDTVLLSPGCASYDMFTDFEHRGRVFKDTVIRLKCEIGSTDDG